MTPGRLSESTLTCGRMRFARTPQHGDPTHIEAPLRSQSPKRQMVMQILVLNFDGTTITPEVSPTDTINRVTAMMQAEVGIPPGQLHLIFAGKKLKDDRLVSDYDINHN